MRDQDRIRNMAERVIRETIKELRTDDVRQVIGYYGLSVIPILDAIEEAKIEIKWAK